MKAVLFDLDGTLLDTLEDLFFSVNHSLKSLSLAERTRKEVRSYLGNGAENLVLRSLPDGEKERLPEALALFREHYAQHSEDYTAPYDGIPALLDRLEREGYAMAIISNKPDFAVQTLAKTHFPRIGYAVGEREGIRRKPEPDSLLIAMEAMGVKKEDCIYVGDSEVDVKTAASTGIPCIAVTWGFRDLPDLKEAGAEHFAADADELYTKIGELL
jgi:phosphoglycolate phosphatase